MVSWWAITALVVDACAAGQVLDDPCPAVLPRRTQLHFDSTSSVSSVDVNCAVAGVARTLDVVEHPIRRPVASKAVGSETLEDPGDGLR